ncbi:MAG: SDR family NAD(P)-dependent oxidoreductase [Catenulisporales bacterium]|nr:SDR family NAD(P)-dependent oxidoreductase [Catenulisporales bacterium]
MMAGTTVPKAEPIAVIGVACRLPGADGPEAFWRLLRDGVDAVTEAAEDRWPSGVVPEYRRGGFVSGVDRFDAAFFGISPHEAAAMDPQQRLALELAWEALEDARIVPGRLAGAPVGVFVGAIANDYAVLASRLESGAHTYTGAHRAMIANRISYLLGLRGPSLTLDAGQSSSLLAVQHACESLARGESESALALGVNLNLLAETTAAIGSFGALSPTGRCHVFDRRADGYVRGEGGAVVVLKPLAAARRDGDPVHAVILGGAVNNDGGGPGLTAPNADAQREVIELACRTAGVGPADVQYVELHGTGTPAGDPVEARALGAALGTGRAADRPLLVGSVKTNIGHLEGAAGIAGLLKVVLSLAHGELPPSLHFESPNPEIPLDDLRLAVVRTAGPWPESGRPAVAGVSSFGMGGTNCHLVLAAADEARSGLGESGESGDAEGGSAAIARSDPPWVLSGRSAEALRGQARALAGHLAAKPDTEPGLALLRTRTQFEYRAVIDAEDRGAKLAALESVASGLPGTNVVVGTATRGKTVFAFPGQGSQWPGMAAALLQASPEFAARVAECEEALRPHVDYSLTDVLRGAPGAPSFDRVDVVQPALWAVMVSLAEVWRARGVRPDAVIGHSQGEIAAATVAGALTLADGARVVALRSRAITRIAGAGGMLSVAAPLPAVEALMGPHATVAAVNGPRSVVLSGPADVLAELRDAYEAAGHRAKLVQVDYASHSPAVDEIREEILTALAPITPRPSATEFVSSVTGEPIDTTGLDAEYWFRNLRQTVRFAAAARRALEDGCGLFIECSPHPVLAGALEETIEEAARTASVVGTLHRDQGGTERIRQALAEAYVAGAGVDWTGPVDVRPAQLAALPTYAFQRSRYWLPDAASVSGSGSVLTPRPLAPSHDGADSATPATLAGHTRRTLLDLVLTSTADVLGHQSTATVHPDWRFKDLGVDSAAAVRLRNRLRAATGLALPTGLLYDYPSPEQVADRLHALLAGAAPAVAASSVDRAAATGDDPVVIVAMGCRYPGGVTSPDELWQLVSDGVDAVSEFPTNRGWDFAALFAAGADRSGTSDTRRGGFLHDADRFDAAFFGISPREAAAMDPQQRLMLEVCWEAFERAGLDADALRGSRTGVFIGAMMPDYGPRLYQPNAGIEGHLLTGTALSVVSGRISYAFGLTGPALTVDTACSSSLVAVHLAADALRRGECSLALAGGVTVMSTAGMFVEFSRQGGLSPDGRCKAFSAEADGTGWAEGAGVLVLERLSDARRHGHPVLAAVRGSAVNQDGRSNGLTAPSGPAQERVIHAALADAGLAAEDIDAAEAHGTGTTLGDPIEAGALLATYGAGHTPDRPLWLGSVKSNLGHTQAAAGVAGVIKMVKAMEHGVLPRTLHAEQPSPHVDWSAGTVRLLTRPVALPADRPARVSVSSYGISGTNAHVIVEGPAPAPALSAGAERPEADPTGDTESDIGSGPLVWVFSTRTESALPAQAARLREFAATASAADLAAAGPVLAARTVMEHRAVVVARDREDLLAALTALVEGGVHPGVMRGVAGADVRPVFVFPGQGSQWAGMAVELLASEPVFRDALARCDTALAEYTGWSVADVLAGRDGAPELAGSDVVQPVLFAVMVSLAELWRSLGVEPAAVVGHSQGEITAACVAGALSVEDAARIVALRSRALMKLTGTGAMLAVALPVEAVRERLAPWADRLWVAILSGPAGTVVGGDPDALEEFAATLGAGVQARKVAIDYAAHTPHIEALREDLLAALAGVEPRPTDVGFCSAAEGRFVETDALTAEYWYQSLRNPVRFEEAIRAFTGFGTPLFVEASPHPVLIGHIQDTARAAGIAGDAFGSLRRGDGGRSRFLLSAAQAFVAGAPVDWRRALGPVRRRVELPTYPFEHRRHWIDSGGPAVGHPLLDPPVRLAEGGGLLLAGRLSVAAAPWLADHVVDGSILLPGTAFLELTLQAGAAAGAARVEELNLWAPVVLSAADAVQMQLVVGGPDEAGRCQVTMYTRAADDVWTKNATATVAPDTGSPVVATGAWPTSAGETDLDDFYGLLTERGYEYGPAFRGLVGALGDGGDRLVEVALPETVRGDAGRFAVHPALLDAVLHVVVRDSVGEDGTLVLPFAFSGVRVTTHGADALRVRITDIGADRVALAAFDTAGRPVLTVDDLTLRRVPRGGSTPSDGSYQVVWNDFAVDATDLAGQRVAVVGTGAAADELRAALARTGVSAELVYDLPSLADLSAGAVPETVLVPYLPDVDPYDVPYSAREGLSEALDLVQGWVADDRFAASRLVFVTRGVGDGTVEGVAAAPLWGLVRSALTEHPGRFAIADVAVGADWRQMLAAFAGDESQLRLRDDAVQVPRLVRVDSEPDENESIDTAFAAGTVLITGGTGGLGALVARRLVEVHGARRLLLVSRRGAAAPGAEEVVRTLEQLGAEVTVLAADVADRAAVAKLLDAIPTEHPLSGVVHAAGVLDDSSVAGLSAARLDATLGPKADAAWYLHELAEAAPAAKFVFFSSVAGILGTGGQGNYAAANAFLDALAVHRQRQGRPAVSIAWGLWATQTGMTGALTEADVARLGRTGVAPLAAERGLELFDRAVRSAEPLIVAAEWDLSAVRAQAAAGSTVPGLFRALVRPRRAPATTAPTAPSTPTVGSQNSQTPQDSWAHRLAGTSEADGRKLLVDLVRSHAAAVLGHSASDSVGVDREFTELGFDSLTAVELRNRLDAATGLRLPSAAAFDHPTIAAMAEFLHGELAPSGPPLEDTLRQTLEQVQAALPAGDEATRTKLVALLRSGLDRLGGDRTAAVATADPVDSATDEEIFAYIDRQFSGPARD